MKQAEVTEALTVAEVLSTLRSLKGDRPVWCCVGIDNIPVGAFTALEKGVLCLGVRGGDVTVAQLVFALEVAAALDKTALDCRVVFDGGYCGYAVVKYVHTEFPEVMLSEWTVEERDSFLFSPGETRL